MLQRAFSLIILLSCCASLRYNPLVVDLERDRLEGNVTANEEVSEATISG